MAGEKITQSPQNLHACQNRCESLSVKQITRLFESLVSVLRPFSQQNSLFQQSSKPRAFVPGMHLFFEDTKALSRVSTGLIKGKQLHEFSRYELENYRQVSIAQLCHLC